MHTISCFAPALRAALALPVALTLAACPFPKDIGDSPLDSDTDVGTTTGDGTSTTAPSPTTTGETGDTTGDTTDTSDTGGSTVPDDEPTTTSPEPTTSSTDDTTMTSSTDETTTLPPDPDGLCVDPNHGEYFCECMESLTQACGDDGVQVCLIVSDVIDERKWSACGPCGPGDARACDAGGRPGQQFCNLNADDLWLESFDQAPTAAWGTCLAQADIVCQPSNIPVCEDDVGCVVDDMGVPFIGPCVGL